MKIEDEVRSRQNAERGQKMIEATANELQVVAKREEKLQMNTQTRCEDLTRNLQVKDSLLTRLDAEKADLQRQLEASEAQVDYNNTTMLQ